MASIVRHDLARITGALGAWQRRTFPSPDIDLACPDTGGGSPAASMGGVYKPPVDGVWGTYTYPVSDAYPSFLKVDVAVEYRSAVNSQRFIAAFDRPSVLRCTKASEIAYWRHGKYPSKPPFPRVSVAAGLPRGLSAALGRDSNGYHFTVITAPGRPGRVPLFYALHFGFRDPTNPHVAYYVIIYEDQVVKHPLQTDVSLARRVSLLIIHAAR